MDLTTIDRALDLLTPDEGRAVFRFIDACERNGTISRHQADEWRRRIVVRWIRLRAGIVAKNSPVTR